MTKIKITKSDGTIEICDCIKIEAYSEELCPSAYVFLKHMRVTTDCIDRYSGLYDGVCPEPPKKRFIQNIYFEIFWKSAVMIFALVVWWAIVLCTLQMVSK